MSERLFIVFLRRPGKVDKRNDPFWEFGSFGCTGCHSHNLLNPKKQHVKDGDYLAFVQGGSQGCKLLLITPPVKRIEYGKSGVEICWDKKHKPFRYATAPILAKPATENITLVELGRVVNKANRSTAQAKLASHFRCRCKQLDPKIAAEVRQFYARAEDAATRDKFIKDYTDALPHFDLKLSPKERTHKYHELRGKLKNRYHSAKKHKC